MSKKELENFETAAISLWDSLSLADGGSGSRCFGPVKLYFKHISNEIWIAVDRSQNESIDDDSLDWSRWALKKETSTIKMFPLMPDKQVVVRPEYPFRLAAGAEVRIYTRIPVWVGVYADNQVLNKLTEVPTILLSKTWFGDFLDGILCYWVTTTARRVVTESAFQPHSTICTLNIKNESNDDLQIEKLSLRVDRLSIFENEGQLWTDEMDIRYKGGDQHSEITMKGKVPSEVKNAKLLSRPRNPERKGIAERTFKILSEIPGFS